MVAAVSLPIFECIADRISIVIQCALVFRKQDAPKFVCNDLRAFGQRLGFIAEGATCDAPHNKGSLIAMRCRDILAWVERVIAMLY